MCTSPYYTQIFPEAESPQEILRSYCNLSGGKNQPLFPYFVASATKFFVYFAYFFQIVPLLLIHFARKGWIFHEQAPKSRISRLNGIAFGHNPPKFSIISNKNS